MVTLDTKVSVEFGQLEGNRSFIIFEFNRCLPMPALDSVATRMLKATTVDMVEVPQPTTSAQLPS